MENKVVVNKDNSSTALIAKIIAIVAFCIVIVALFIAFATDIILLSSQILSFIAACFISVLIFFFALILMIISFIFVFGFYILEKSGFWPLQWAAHTFNEIMSEATISKETINSLIGARIVLLVLCIIAFVLSIVCLSLARNARKKGFDGKQGLTKTFGIISLILSILGTLMAILVLLLASIA